MSAASPDTSDRPASAPSDGDDVVSTWMVRLFLVLAFGLAFGIEGMTLIRSYLLEGDDEQTEPSVETVQTAQNLTAREGDALFPDLPVQERIDRMVLQAQKAGPWTFRLEVSVRNDTEGTYRLTVRDVATDDGALAKASHSIDCAPGDSARLVATWPVGADARPQSLTAVAELHLPPDSTASSGQRVQLGHVPVQMVRSD